MNETIIKELHKKLLTAWNNQDASEMASLFTDNGSVVGFDGSENNGKAQIEKEMSKIFKDHQTARYVWQVREVRFLSPEIALLRAVVGMVPPGEEKIKPERNAVQSLIAVKENEGWKIALFQNTPAQYHGSPEVSQALTNELNALV
jgi:uncharacterized protein (TIGR02246 family)